MWSFAVALLIAPAAAVPRVEKNVPYASAGGETLRMDVTRPAGVGAGPRPCVICFHGGAWKWGNRTQVAGLPDELAAAGVVGVTASYRLAPKHKWPAQIEDAKTAVRFLRANAAKFGIDPARIGVLGFSAGGHLSALLGTTDADAGFDGPLFPGVSSKVQAVVDYFGPADLALYAETPGVEKAFFVPLIGKRFADDPITYRNASPVERATKTAPPFLIIHGVLDVIVPIVHSERLHQKLRAAGAESEFVSVPGVGHGWDGPPRAASTKKAVAFLKTTLAGDAK